MLANDGVTQNITTINTSIAAINLQCNLGSIDSETFRRKTEETHTRFLATEKELQTLLVSFNNSMDEVIVKMSALLKESTDKVDKDIDTLDDCKRLVTDRIDLTPREVSDFNAVIRASE